MKLIWLTDIHLNFLDDHERRKFYQEVSNTHGEAILITGDIAEATCLGNMLNEMADYIKKPIYFVLGNHDYYRGLINTVRESMAALTKAHERLFWLPASGIQSLDKNTILLGQDGWADGRLGDYINSKISLNDSRMIMDLFQARMLGRFQLLNKMQQLADADAMELHKNLIKAINQYPKKIIILTHVPPFKEACMHEGKMSDKHWLPFYSSKATGDVLLQIAKKNPYIKFLVLCGHTHSEAHYQLLENLTVQTGKAEYYQPLVGEITID